jgi:hypothetical protein
MSEQTTPAGPNSADAPFIFRYSVHPEHLEAPRESMKVHELKAIIAQHVASFDPTEQLVLEDAGDEPDRLLTDDDVVEIVSVPHFYSASHERDYTIYVNAELKTVHKRVLSFEEIVAIAFPIPQQGQEVRYTVTYKRAILPKPHGSLKPGQSVTIRKNGTIFDVVRTYKS